jgi:hypothetical protein
MPAIKRLELTEPPAVNPNGKGEGINLVNWNTGLNSQFKA